MRRLFCYALAAAAAFGQTTDHPTGTRITPPTVNVVTPRGVARGTTVELTVEGLNLAKASGVFFDKPGITGRIVRVKELPDLPDIRLGSNGTPSTIDLGPLPPRNQVTIELEISPEAEIGPVNFRLQNHLGTSPEGRLLIEPYYGESPDREPNNSVDTAFETFLPTILVGEISRPGDVDYYKIKVKAGEEIVFENGAETLGSTLQPVVGIVAEDQSLVKEFGYDGGRSQAYFAHRFEKGGTYFIRVTDYEQSGRASHSYRIKAGSFPLVTGTFPLGIQRGANAALELRGFHLGSTQAQVKGEPRAESEDTLLLRPATRNGSSFQEITLAIGQDPEVMAGGTNTALASAQAVTIPVTINGRMTAAENVFKFRARKNEKIVFEVMARRFNSELDSAIEVLDGAGKPIETHVVRAVMETSTTLRDHDSVQRGIRLASYTGWEAGDYYLCGNEVGRIDAMPLQPDADIVTEAFGGQRMAFFGTSTEAHAIERGFYKVQIHPAGKQFTPNGLPLVRLYARNDDGGPGYGKDSYLEFTAPSDGDYYVKIRDVRGLTSADSSYRLNIRPPRPDFRLSMSPRNPNVPAGGTIPLTVTARRLDGFGEAITVTLENLPAGLRSTQGVIAPGQTSTTILLTADASAKVDKAVSLKAAGTATIAGQTVARYANPDDKLKLVALMPKPDVIMTAQTKEVILEPGATAQVAVNIERQNGFGGRVPVAVLNLPPRVRVVDVGLNGVLINEDEKQRSFTLEALPSAPAGEQTIYVAGVVETRSTLPSVHAAMQPIKLIVKPARAQLSDAQRNVVAGSAPKK